MNEVGEAVMLMACGDCGDGQYLASSVVATV